MLVLIGKQMNDSTIVGYRVAVLNTNGSQSIQCSGVRTIDTYQILQLMYTKDLQTNSYFQFLNADLYYTMQEDMDYKLTVENDALIWVYEREDGTMTDRRVITNCANIDVQNLKLKPIGNEIWSYGLYPEQGTPYVVLAMKCDARNRPISYYVVDAAFEAGDAIEEMKSDMFISKMEYRANHYRHDGVANGLMENGVFKPYGRIITLRDSTATANISNTVPVSSLLAGGHNEQSNQNNQTNNNNVRTVFRRNRNNEIVDSNVSMSVDSKTVVVPNSITKIQDGLLINNPYIEKLVIHSGVQSVEPHSLLNCPNLTAFEVEQGNIYMCSPGGLLISKNGAEFLRCPPKTTTNITGMPKYTKKIAAGAFRGVTNLHTLIIPPTVEEIEAGAFVDCPNLTQVTVFSKIIHEDVFVNCPNLSTLMIAKGVEKITGTLVRNCPKLQFLVLPDTLLSIESKTYAEWLPNGIAAEQRLHKLIEYTPIRFIFAPTTMLNYVSNFYTDNSMYDTRNGKKFMFLQNTEQNLLSYKLGAYLKLVR